ncbi:hypothetical protein [Nocardioides convexus]|uniref:hypothetical protein n=1 Tax=Nocardioides convexus TaxID=2712224 RepID=UPI0024185EDA|nr:hypothetical protein [Nocardioides convexus]
MSRSIFPIVSAADRAYFGTGGEETDQVGQIDDMRAIFGRTYADEPDRLVEQPACRRGHRRGGHPAADRAEPARRRVQRARAGVDPQPRRTGARLALSTRLPSAR